MAPKADTIAPGQEGRLVRTALGIGRIVAIEDRQAHVRYFQSPGRQPYVDQQHDVTHVALTTLPVHTRAYLYDGRRWRIGRVDGQHPQHPDQYLIAFPNSEGAVLAVDAFDVRWDAPIADPFELLEAVGGDSPLVYESRLGVLGAWGSQRAVATGVEGLLLSSVELHQHQLQVVRRVAADPIKRYLLADEVGLGKTIEAAALIRQFLDKLPSARALIVAPEHLREQWAGELLKNFRTDEFTDSWLRIRSQENEASWPSEPVDLLVIDEAHHVTRTGPLSTTARTLLTKIAHQAQALLLLSATPVRSNEAGFLDLLHLLDPLNYGPNQLDEFVRRVELRDQLALTYQALVPNIDEFDLSLYAEELRSHFPEDATLDTLLAVALSTDDAGRPDHVGRLRAHLSETYRLHHRLLRTRRTPDIGSTFAVRGRRRGSPFTLEVTDPSDVLRGELLDSLRAELVAAVEGGRCTTEEAVLLLRDAASRSSSLSHALLSLHESAPPSDLHLKPLGSLVEPGVWSTWNALVEDIYSSHDYVLEELGDVLSRITVARGLQRVVLASAFTATAKAVAEEMTRRWGRDRVATHLVDQDDAANGTELRRWREEGPCSVLVCDAGAEEGLNLQDAELLVHLDLPWDSFRVEQRIGRCDRHGRPGSGPIPSAVVVFGDQPYALSWFEFLADGCGVFTNSVSSLQYVLSDTEREVQTTVLLDGPSALSDAVEGQARILAQEQTRIVAHDSLDAIDEPGDGVGDRANQALLASDQDKQLTAALVTWLEGVGAGVRRPAPGTIRIGRKPRPQVPFGLELAMAPFLETDLAVDRVAAVNRALPILRAGHPLADLVADHLRTTDRGIAFAMFRPARGQWPPVVVLRSDFQITLYPGPALCERASDIDLSDWLAHTTSELAPPSIETVVVTPDGVEVSHPSLRQPYNKQHGDRNLSSRPELFERLIEHFDWSTTCATALAHSQARLGERAALTERREVTAAAIARLIRQLADRDQARERAGLEREGHRWDELAEIPIRTLEARVEIVGCGTLFIGDPQELDRRA